MSSAKQVGPATITDEMVERVAEVLRAQFIKEERRTWGKLVRRWPDDAELWRGRARAALNALAYNALR